MTVFNKKLLPIAQGDPRYAYEAYEFVFQALEHTHRSMGREPPDETTDPDDARYEVTARQWVEGMCDLARHEFGLMAPIVFHMWGIRKTDDFGEIVFNLIDAELMGRTPEDSRSDFHGLFDLDEALTGGFRIVLEEE